MTDDHYLVEFEAPEGTCIVCGKHVTYGDETVRLHLEDGWITVCCSLCFEAYERSPEHYLAKHGLNPSAKRNSATEDRT